MAIKSEILELVANENAREIFLELNRLIESGDELVYYNKLQRNLSISKPTLNKYLNLFLELNIISINSSEGEMSEYFRIKKTGREVSRVRRMWVRQIKIQNTVNTKTFRELLKSFDNI